MLKKLFTCSMVLLGIGAGVVNGDLVNEITIWDGEDGNNYSGGWFSVGYHAEDGEVEDGCVNEQKWDLEGVFLDGGLLTMVGGYDFAKNTEFKAGDLFIDVTGDVIYGPAAALASESSNYANVTVANNFGYDYVLDFNDDFSKYNVYSITDASTVDVYYNVNNNSNPWRYAEGGVLIGSGSVFSTTYTDAQSGFSGGTHNAVTVDLSFLDGEDITTHFTMGCGNDNLMGQGSVSVPEPAILPLLGVGLLIIGLGIRRKKG